MESNLSQIELVKDINPAANEGYSYYLAGSNPSYLTEFKDQLYFAATGENTGSELWVSDGTAEGTNLVADIRPNDSQYNFNNGSNLGELIEFRDRLYFVADNGENGRELWVSDGTTEGTQLFADIRQNNGQDSFDNSSFIDGLTVAGKNLFFAADNGENGRELWVSDGTTVGTKLVKDINPGVTDGYFYPFEPRVDSSSPQEFLAVGDLVYFSADDGESGRELWVSDGTTEGTKLVKDINLGFDDSEYIYNRAGKSRRLENPRPLGSNPDNLVEFNDQIYFSANDGENGRELWVSDGTSAGTKLLVDLNPGISEYDDPNSSYASNLIEFQDRLFFTASNGEQGEELWVTDGTVEGTQLFKDINQNTTANFGFINSDSYARFFTEFDNQLFFTADNGEVGRELWVSDGTTEGTRLVKDINPEISYFGEYSSPDGSGIYGFTEFSGRLYFAARTENEGRELWVTDGTTEGTQLVEDLRPGFRESYGDTFPYSSYPDSLTVIGNELFFAADDGEVGTELFKLTADDLNAETNSDAEDTEATSSASVSEDGQIVSSSSSSSSNAGTVSSSSSVFNVAGSVTLTGGEGGDRLTGNSGDDLLDGNLGNDTLAGGLGTDTFVLRAGDGTDTIADFELGTDRLGLAESLQFEDLSFSGHTISFGDEVLANLNGIDTTSLTISDIEVI